MYLIFKPYNIGKLDFNNLPNDELNDLLSYYFSVVNTIDDIIEYVYTDIGIYDLEFEDNAFIEKKEYLETLKNEYDYDDDEDFLNSVYGRTLHSCIKDCLEKYLDINDICYVHPTSYTVDYSIVKKLNTTTTTS